MEISLFRSRIPLILLSDVLHPGNYFNKRQMNEEHVTSGQRQRTECCRSLEAIKNAWQLIGGKWRLRIALVLIDGAKRFTEIQRLLKPISPRVLSHELKELELNGLIRRRVYSATPPVVVEYEVTEYGLTLRNVLESLAAWGQQYRRMK